MRNIPSTPARNTLNAKNVCKPPPAPLQNPPRGETVEIGGFSDRPFDPSILDFHFDTQGTPGLFGSRFPTDKLFGTPRTTPKKLMQDYKMGIYRADAAEVEPDLRWIHLPFSSMKYAEEIIQMACEDRNVSDDISKKFILRQDRWEEKVHKKRKKDGYHARFMHTYCSEIVCERDERLDETHRPYCHRGANLVLFMPYLHWGSLDVLKWREEQIELIENGQAPQQNPDLSLARQFYAELMQKQLCSEKPLHIRRTLDQFYYSHMKNTYERDCDQVVSRYGRGGEYWDPIEDMQTNAKTIVEKPKPRHWFQMGREKGHHKDVEESTSTESSEEHHEQDDRRTVLMVDKLWLWILGGRTVITCFDRRWEEQSNPRSNVFENVVWKLDNAGQSRNIKTPYDLANLIIDEASSFFFYSTDDHPDSPRFSELFHKAISATNERQIRRFDDFKSLSKDRVMDLNSEKQDRLFDVSNEFTLFTEIRDVIDELNMIHLIYKEQLGILPALKYAQYHYALFYDKKTNENGEHKVICEPDESGRLPDQCQSGWEVLPEINFDPRDWYERTHQYMEKHHEEIVEMMEEASRVSNALRDTIDLKQNSASIFEAHVSRREGEAIMLFTVLSSLFLPLSFFTSFFGMNIVEINQGSYIKFRTALSIIFPVSFVIFAIAMFCAFTRKARNSATEMLTFKTKTGDRVRHRWEKFWGH